MTHWGWYWKVKLKHTPKMLCSQLPRLDSFEIARTITGTQGMPVSCTVVQNERSTKIMVEQQACHRGGFRYFFRCTLCHGRKRILYIADTIACRTCLRLCYLTQRMVSSDRALSRYHKIVVMLRKRRGSLTEKPRRMHIATWKRLVQNAYNHDTNYEERLRSELRSYYPSRAHLIG